MATQSWVNREYRRGLSTHPCGSPVLRGQRGGGDIAYPHHLGSDHLVAAGDVQLQGSILGDELGGDYAEL